jgi:hypothetical protein
MASRITVTPAYGRDYRNQAEIERDWEAGKDFTITDISSRWNGSAINKEDAVSGGITEVNVRYQGNRKVHVIKVSAGLRASTLQLAASLPNGDPVRRQLLATLKDD